MLYKIIGLGAVHGGQCGALLLCGSGKLTVAGLHFLHAFDQRTQAVGRF